MLIIEGVYGGQNVPRIIDFFILYNQNIMNVPRSDIKSLKNFKEVFMKLLKTKIDVTDKVSSNKINICKASNMSGFIDISAGGGGYIDINEYKESDKYNEYDLYVKITRYLDISKYNDWWSFNSKKRKEIYIITIKNTTFNDVCDTIAGIFRPKINDDDLTDRLKHILDKFPSTKINLLNKSCTIPKISIIK